MARHVASLLLILSLGLAIFSFSFASTTTHLQLNSLLGSYNVSNSLITTATYINVSYQNKNYTIVYEGSTPYFLVNTSSSQYSFVLNSSAISSIISNETIVLLEKQLNLNAISTSVSAYMETSASSLADCVVETGIDRGTCTLGNYCESCSLVPACNKVLFATNGPSGTLGEGIMSFEQSYASLENNLSILKYYANQSSLSNSGNAGANVILDAREVSNAYNNISTITQNLYKDPIFPPPQSSNYALCNEIGATNFNISTGGPWYCNALGYCQFLTYNYTMLNNINAMVNSINAMLPTQQKINSVAQNVSKFEDQLIVPILKKQKYALFSNTINVTLSTYSKVVNETGLLLLHISNTILSSDLSVLESNFSYLKSNYLTLNITTYSLKISAQLSTVSSLYSSLNAAYSALLQKAKNNTILLISAQLSNPSSVMLSQYAFKQNAINAELNSKVGNISLINTSLSAISKNISYVNGPDISLQALSRWIDGPFVSLLSTAANLPYSQTVVLAPVFSSLLSLIIGLIILLIIFLWYRTLMSRRRIRVTHNTLRSWELLFILLLIIVLIYMGLTYLVASSANASAPLSSFSSALSSSHSLAIVVNRTNDQSFAQCAEIINTTAKQSGYSSKIYTISNNICSGSLMNESDCLNSFARAGVPVILLSYANVSSIGIYSMYGTMLSLKGNDAFVSSCYASFFIR